MLIATFSVRNQIRQGELHELPSALMTGAKDGVLTWERYDEVIALEPGSETTAEFVSRLRPAAK